MTQNEPIIELGLWLTTPPGRYLLAWEQERLDHAVTDIFGFHALQLGLPEVDTLRNNRMPHRWIASDSLTLPPAIDMPPSVDEQGAPLSIGPAPVALHCESEALPFPDQSQADRDFWVQTHVNLAAQSSQGTQRIVENADHEIYRTNPQDVAAAVAEVSGG